MKMRNFAGALARRIKRIVRRVFRIPPNEPLTGLKIRTHPSVERIGTSYGSWIVPLSVLNDQSICYSLGVGEDATFDLDIIQKVGCHVYACDPTPRAILYGRACELKTPNFHLLPVGVWDKTEVLKFYAPENPQHVSHSVLNIQKTSEYFEASCKRLSEIMKENGHATIDLLKVNIEGAEYKVIDSIIEDNLKIAVLCIEFDELHHPIDAGFRDRVANSIRRIVALGYQIVWVEQSHYTFLLK